MEKIRRMTSHTLNKVFGDNFNSDNMEPIKTSKKILKRELGGTSRLISEYFGPISYTYLIYLIFAFNICMFIILFFRENKFYRKFDDTEIDINLGTNIFYIYIFTIFLILFQLYVLKTNEEIIYEDISYFQIFIEIFNYISIIGLSYYFYKQIDQIDEGCASPRERVCVANTSEGNPNHIDSCMDGPYECVKYDEIPWKVPPTCNNWPSCEDTMNDFITGNFVVLQDSSVIPPTPTTSPPQHPPTTPPILWSTFNQPPPPTSITSNKLISFSDDMYFALMSTQEGYVNIERFREELELLFERNPDSPPIAAPGISNFSQSLLSYLQEAKYLFSPGNDYLFDGVTINQFYTGSIIVDVTFATMNSNVSESFERDIDLFIQTLFTPPPTIYDGGLCKDITCPESTTPKLHSTGSSTDECCVGEDRTTSCETIQEVVIWGNRLNDICCADPGNCNSGIPRSCSPECSEFLDLFLERCSTIISSGQLLSDSLINQLRTVCDLESDGTQVSGGDETTTCASIDATEVNGTYTYTPSGPGPYSPDTTATLTCNDGFTGDGVSTCTNGQFTPLLLCDPELEPDQASCTFTNADYGGATRCRYAPVIETITNRELYIAHSPSWWVEPQTIDETMSSSNDCRNLCVGNASCSYFSYESNPYRGSVCILKEEYSYSDCFGVGQPVPDNFNPYVPWNPDTLRFDGLGWIGSTGPKICDSDWNPCDQPMCNQVDTNPDCKGVDSSGQRFYFTDNQCITSAGSDNDPPGTTSCEPVDTTEVNGTYEYSTEITNGVYSSDTTATLTCNDGFTGDGVSTCTNGQFTPLLRCMPESCEPIDETAVNGSYTYDTPEPGPPGSGPYPPNTVATLNCNELYAGGGDSACINGQFTPPDLNMQIFKCFIKKNNMPESCESDQELGIFTNRLINTCCADPDNCIDGIPQSCSPECVESVDLLLERCSTSSSLLVFYSDSEINQLRTVCDLESDGTQVSGGDETTTYRCTDADLLDSKFSELNDACCSGDCNDGIPDSCSESCAEKIIPLMDNCSNEIRNYLRNDPVFTELNNLRNSCN